MLPETTPEKIRTALAEFDSTLRSSDAWQGWEGSRAQKYALQFDSRLYPPKTIVSLATGSPVSQFSGGDETNNYLRSYGFEVVPLANPSSRALSATEDSMGLAIQSILDTYLRSRTNEPFGRASTVWPQFERFEATLKPLLKSLDRPDLMCYWVAGQGKYTAVPWMAVMDRRETLSTQRGVYCVFLFREDMTGVYLTLNQGATELVAEMGHSR
jgi:5-methylcytosine-specific restriction protein B